MNPHLFDEKLRDARRVLTRCVTRRGVYAGTKRYRYECWTRDLVLAGIDTLFDMGLGEHARRHLEEIAKRQTNDGQIPVMYISNIPAATLLHAGRLLRDPQRAFRQARLFLKTAGLAGGFSFSNLTPWSADCEPLFVIGCYRFAERANDPEFVVRMRPHILRAFRYMENHAMKDGFLIGGDWRDTLGEFKDAALLSNNVLLAAAYAAAGEPENSAELKRRIWRHFWTGSYYRDRLGSDAFDTFGQSLAVLSGVASAEQYQPLLQKFGGMERPAGFAANDLEPRAADPVVRAYVDQYGTVWPFVQGFAILALEMMGERPWAMREFVKWSSVHGFCEWYDPDPGVRCDGEQEQMWSAALYLRVHRTLFPKDSLSAEESATLAPALFFPNISFI